MAIVPVGGKSQTGLRIIFQSEIVTTARERGRMASNVFHVSAMGEASDYFLVTETSSLGRLPLLDFPFPENMNKRESLFSEGPFSSLFTALSW